jgi:protein TonB
MNSNLRTSHALPVASRNYFGLMTVGALHVLLGYALFNGLAHKAIEVLRQPLDVALIEEIKAPPPKPPAAVKAPPPSYVPPAEVLVASVAPATTISATVSTPQPLAEPVRVAPPPVNVGLACPNHMDVRRRVPYPAQAQLAGISGEVMVEFIVGADGEIRDIGIARSSNALFNAVSTAAVGQLRCLGQGHDVRVRVPFVFRLES